MELLDRTFFVMPNWKWIILVGVIVGGFILQPILRGTLKRIKKIPQKWQTQSSFLGHFLQLRVERPFAGILIAVVFIIAFDALELPVKFQRYLLILTHVWLTVNLILICYLLVDAGGLIMQNWAKKSENASYQLIPFATKTSKVLVVILGILLLLQNLGVEVLSLLAGLSIGGLALALAAQDTFANLFGSITIFMDNPFKVGDSIKLGDSEGVVEDIGFRSTRLRTPYNSLISIPNSVVAKERVDNLTLRPARRIRQVLGVAYDTLPEVLNQFCEGIRELLRANPKILPASISVGFKTFNTSTLDIVVVYHIATSVDTEENEITERVNYQIWNLSRAMKVDFAFPTSTVYYKNPPSV